MKIVAKTQFKMRIRNQQENYCIWKPLIISYCAMILIILNMGLLSNQGKMLKMEKGNFGTVFHRCVL